MQDNQLIRELLNQLDHDCFQILYDFWIRDLDEKKIADQKGISKLQVRQDHLRCRKKFEHLLKNHEKNS